MGQAGLHVDDSPSAIPPNAIILGNNVQLYNNFIEKIGGATPINKTPISEIMGMFDFWDTPSSQRLIVVGGDGNTYAIDPSGNVSTIKPSGGAAATLNANNQVFMVAGGAENASVNRRLFIFTGNNVVQTIDGSATVRTDITKPPSDWADANQPSFGIVYRNILLAGGNLNQPHTLYGSLSSDQQNFQDTGFLTLACYPGDGQGLIGAKIYKGRLFVFKYPTGVYYLNDSDPSPGNWYFVKSGENFGFASPHCAINVLNDMLVKNSSGSVTSVQATLEFGSIKAGDVLTNLHIEQYMRDNTSFTGTTPTHAIYYGEKKLALFTYRSSNATKNDTILMMRVDTSGIPKATLINAFAPNCLALRKDSQLIERPIYGSLDGFVYQFDNDSRNVNGNAYTGEFQTPHIDFGFVTPTQDGGAAAPDPHMSARNKIFDFLELRYVPQGDFDLLADIIIDGTFQETIAFSMQGFAELGDKLNPTDADFQLANSSSDPDGDYLADNISLLTLRKRIRGVGRTISVRCYNSGVNENFKIATMIYSFRTSGEQQK